MYLLKNRIMEKINKTITGITEIIVPNMRTDVSLNALTAIRTAIYDNNCPNVVIIEDVAGTCNANNTEFNNDNTKFIQNVMNTIFTKLLSSI